MHPRARASLLAAVVLLARCGGEPPADLPAPPDRSADPAPITPEDPPKIPAGAQVIGLDVFNGSNVAMSNDVIAAVDAVELRAVTGGRVSIHAMKIAAFLACFAAAAALGGCGSSTPVTGTGGTTTTSSAGGGGGAGGAAPVAPHIAFIEVSNPTDLSPDGRFALLQDFESPAGDIYVYDADAAALTKRGDAANPDPAGGDTTKGTPLPPQVAAGLSADATRVVGTHGMPLQPALFAAGAWMDLGAAPGTGVCPGDASNIDDQGSAGAGWDITADGHTVVGMAWDGCAKSRALRWSDAGGSGAFTLLEAGGVGFDRATKIADDGARVGGFVAAASVDRSPALWDATGKLTRLDPSGLVVGEVLAIGADGLTAAGIWNDASGNAGFRWTSAAGVEVLPALPDAMPTDQVFPNAVAAGGALVFGGAGDQNGLGNPLRTFVWSRKDDTTRLLQPLVEAAGLTMPPNMTLASVLAASTDGTAILGTTLEADPMLPFPKQRAFLLRLPLSAYEL